MSALAEHTDELERLTALRGRAASRLTGAAATKGAPARAADALAVLHELASKPETASDALALLHELQVHQVELDLQAQELHESRAELESALRRQIERYDCQPVGCFTIDARLLMLELNRSGAEMLGIGRNQAIGLPIERFFGAESASRLRSVLQGLESGTGRACHPLTLCPSTGPELAVLACVGHDADAGQYLLNLVEVGADQRPRQGGH